MRLAGRIAFVTGSSRGIGAAIARRLAADGAKLVLHARGDTARANAVAEEIRAGGGSADVVTGNLVEGETAAQVVQDAFAVHGALDILVCNAGGGETGLAVDKNVEAIDRILALNLRAVILSTIEFARLTQSPHGRVVLISSGSATHPAYGATIYAAAKAGAEAFMRSVAQELGERGITLNTVAPGTTRTEMIALSQVQAELKEVIRSSSLRADSAHALVDLAVANPTFTVRKVEADLGVSYGRANKLVGQLVELGVLQIVDANAYKRRFFAPRVMEVLTHRAVS